MLWPRDEYAFFDAPTTTVVQVPGPTVVQLCQADPDRRVLIISGDGTTTLTVSLSPSVLAGRGILLPAACPVLVLDYERHRAIVQSAWFAIAGGLAFASVTVATMHKDPRVFGYPQSYSEQAAQPERVASAPRGKGGRNGRRLPYRSGLFGMFNRQNPNLFGE